jgi:hypothetical protein
MKTKAEIHAVVDKWWDQNIVGNLILYRAPHTNEAEAIIEQVVKKREMSIEIQAAFEMFMDELGIERGEIVRDKNGNPDRVKLTKRFE